ncbi:unnamed protein product [Hymenolepis diminuta]|uniref:Uncharacterized protein n=1 Tax=Hymenolepis diminuta TaxID=6216 RepID=A0A0R3SZ00_HYMDI|nr:unnamed protein product [Hymenolepis diminuta]
MEQAEVQLLRPEPSQTTQAGGARTTTTIVHESREEDEEEEVDDEGAECRRSHSRKNPARIMATPPIASSSTTSRDLESGWFASLPHGMS